MMIRPYKVNLGTTSGHLESENFVDFPCKRHHRSTLVFSPLCFASRGSPVRSRPRPPTIFVSMKYRRSVPRIPPATQAGGRGFESRHVHKPNPRSLNILCSHFQCTIGL